MDLTSLMPRRTERMMICGRTGSGKTVLAKCLLAAADYPRIIVIDSKCTYGGKGGQEGYELVRSPRELWKLPKRYDRIQFRPSPAHQSVEHYDDVYKWCYNQGGILVYSDELYLTMRGTRSPDWQRACITCGRELGIGMISGTQRPRGIDPRVRTEADVKAQFDLEEEEDVITMWGRTRAKQIVALEDAMEGGKPEHSFWFYRPGMGRLPKLTRLSLKGAG